METAEQANQVRDLMRQNGSRYAWIGLQKNESLAPSAEFFISNATIAQRYLLWHDRSPVDLELTMNDFSLHHNYEHCVALEVNANASKLVDRNCGSSLKILCMQGK